MRPRQDDEVSAYVHADRFRTVATIKRPDGESQHVPIHPRGDPSDAESTSTWMDRLRVKRSDAESTGEGSSELPAQPPESVTDDGRELSPLNFYALLLSRENTVKKSRAEITAALGDDTLRHPMHHYWIASSHNTYLEDNQLTGHSNADMYRRVLLQALRCARDASEMNDRDD